MNERETIEIHIEECKHRVGVINMFLKTRENISNELASESGKNIAILKTAITALEEIQQYRKIGTVAECQKAVENLPTAYDVDKVVEQLKAELKKYYGWNWYNAPYLVKAIEIVKGGGLDE